MTLTHRKLPNAATASVYLPQGGNLQTGFKHRREHAAHAASGSAALPLPGNLPEYVRRHTCQIALGFAKVGVDRRGPREHPGTSAPPDLRGKTTAPEVVCAAKPGVLSQIISQG